MDVSQTVLSNPKRAFNCIEIRSKNPSERTSSHIHPLNAWNYQLVLYHTDRMDDDYVKKRLAYSFVNSPSDVLQHIVIERAVFHFEYRSPVARSSKLIGASQPQSGKHPSVPTSAVGWFDRSLHEPVRSSYRFGLN